MAQHHDHDDHDPGHPEHDHLAHEHAHHHGSHAHGAGHHHHLPDPHDNARVFFVAVALNSAFVAVETAYGLIANSTALLADAGHNLSDVLGLCLAWGAAILARKAPSGRYTYGLRSTSILAALANAMFLVAACGAIAWEAAGRMAHPPPVAGWTVTWVAAFGLVVNGVSAWMFTRGSKVDLNMRGAYLHMVADAAVSLAVVIAGVAMIATRWYWLDPLLSLVVVAVILAGTWSLLRESVQLALNAVPAHIDVRAVEAYLRQCPGVAEVHDLHIWGMSTTESALTAHLVMPQGYPGDAFVDEIMHTLKARFLVQHSTLQVEQGTTQHACALHPDMGHSHGH